MQDCLIVGAGVIGLSIAKLLADQGSRVRVLDAGEPGRESSWAGAGILEPAEPLSSRPTEVLATISNRLHAAWAAELMAETGIDNGYRQCGGYYLARGARAAEQLDDQIARWRAGGVAVEDLSPAELTRHEAALRPSPAPARACFVSVESQVRNPRHLQALVAACARRRVSIQANQQVVDFLTRGSRIEAVVTPHGRFAADVFCLAAGSWSSAVASRLGVSLAIKPIRGQIVLLAGDKPAVGSVVNEGKRYLTPREDGLVLVGSTEEDVGFDRGTTPEVGAELRAFAASLVPSLETFRVQRQWAGLRPATADGAPYIGRAPGWDNAFICAGHFRHGLQWSTGSALAISRLVCGQEPGIDLKPFDPARAAP